MEYKIAVCGMGPHTKKCHYAILEELSGIYNLSVELLIDLKSRQSIIEKWLTETSLKPKRCLFLDDTQDNILGTSLDGEADKALTELLNSGNLNKLMVSTEPKCHKIYALWGLQHNIDVIVDKPLTANKVDSEDAESSKLLIKDFDEIHEAVKKSSSRLYVMIPKRKRPSYSIIKEYADEIIREHKIPLTYIGMNVNEGMWNMPDEFFTRENHPYKYGYGGLLHSGYHYTDFILWLMESNSAFDHYKIDKLRMSIEFTTPNDFVHRIPNEFYKEKFGKDYSQYINDSNYAVYNKMGELDTFLHLQGYNNNACITNANLSVLHTSFSSRAWTNLPDDTYTCNGRIHHHDFNLQFGTVCSINSTQRIFPVEVENGGSYENGDCIIEIFRNTDVIGGKPYEKIVFEEQKNKLDREYHGKRAEIEDWLNRSDSICEFKHHLKNISFLQMVYEQMAKIRTSNDTQYMDLRAYD